MPVTEVATLPLPTGFGSFTLRAFETSDGFVYLALVIGDVPGDEVVPVRLHSECLTGDALGSLRCDCGIQLRTSMRAIAASGRGVVLYMTGHEGRGIGLVNKLRAYIEQDRGADTLDANLHLGLPADARDYTAAAAVLLAMGVERVQLITNNPAKAASLVAHGVNVVEVLGVSVASGRHNNGYLRTKQRRFGHRQPLGSPLGDVSGDPPDVSDLLGDQSPPSDRPWVTVKYAQSLDGRIATATGDSKWISGTEERAVSHALRAGCDAILVGAGTVVNDDPRLTVRLVPGNSPVRVVLDTELRIPPDAAVLDDDAPTVIFTTAASDPSRRAAIERKGVSVRVVQGSSAGVDLAAALCDLRARGVTSVLAEGGSRVITSLLHARVVDRVIVGIAPIVLGAGLEGVGDLGITEVARGLRLHPRALHTVGRDILAAFDVECAPAESASTGPSSRPEGHSFEPELAILWEYSA